MSMTVPVVTPMAAGYTVQSSDMNNLAAACSFLLGKPCAQVVATTARSGIPATSGGAATEFDSASFDTDGMWNSNAPRRLTVQTPGYYKVRYTVVTENVNVFQTWMESTAGPNNPAGSGVTSGPQLPGYGVGQSGLPSTGSGCAGIWPFYLYPGDYLQVFVFASAPTSWEVSPVGSEFSLEYVST